MDAKVHTLKSPNEEKHELVSSWSWYMFIVLDDKLEKALISDINTTYSIFCTSQEGDTDGGIRESNLNLSAQ
ncbi:MAG: hypothetical protein ACI9FN_001725 [Saprospiraceae bacterium]|jgi:hypothetical protein